MVNLLLKIAIARKEGCRTRWSGGCGGWNRSTEREGDRFSVKGAIALWQESAIGFR
ncbi:MAG: hypothetical protein QNJ46_22470 [Leptolyngbyaceae cyanobacterium MO_188.B28]|nr:hypothetical protein [Leptolyngbyaceae cyanobacterium MO_188.B28]